jgi:hypothetical protein
MMNDPHVERLIYRLKVNPSHQLIFENPPPLFQEYDAFTIRLENENLTVEMKEHFPTVESAKKKVEEFLRDWLNYARFDFEWDLLYFKYESAEVIDRNPPPTLPGQCTFDGNVVAPMPTCKATFTTGPIKVSQYPAPPTRFRASPDLETMWFRYQQHLHDKETYQSLGYFCLSLMQWSTGVGKGARDAASRIYNIDRGVLDKLGELTSERGTQRDARKLDSGSTLVPLTDVESRWIRETVKMLIRRKGEYDFEPATGTSLKRITMTHLPKL